MTKELSVEERGNALLARLPVVLNARWVVTNLGGGWTITLTRIQSFRGATENESVDAALAALAAREEPAEGQTLSLLRRAFEVIRRVEVRLDADCSGESPLTKEIRAHLEGTREVEELPQAVKAAARAAFDYATESDEHSDRFELWWATYSHEVEELPGDGQRPGVGLANRVYDIAQELEQTPEHALSAIIELTEPFVRDTEREHEPAERESNDARIEREREEAKREAQDAHVLAEALRKFLRHPRLRGTRSERNRCISELEDQVNPTLQALGYGKD